VFSIAPDGEVAQKDAGCFIKRFEREGRRSFQAELDAAMKRICERVKFRGHP